MAQLGTDLVILESKYSDFYYDNSIENVVGKLSFFSRRQLVTDSILHDFPNYPEKVKWMVLEHIVTLEHICLKMLKCSKGIA